ncbi:HNH endonuclease signature motif containing protein [Ruminococcus sp.]|uniref:HNH endonuclease n=1 Tax=Ruminococcus sp. TaxID=41978 RepID=UPI0025D64D18|nr:HNH endonuclease signature motif containing protein [Ruminococcus sp.]
MSQRKSISKATRLKVYEKYDGHCAYCGCTLELKDMQVDHIQSVYWYDGANDIENYNPACRMCNFYKSTMSVEDFREQLGKILSRLEKVFIFRLAKKYGLIREIKEPVIFYFEKENLKKVMDFEREKLSLKEKELEKFEKSNNVKSLFVDNPELLEE